MNGPSCREARPADRGCIEELRIHLSRGEQLRTAAALALLLTIAVMIVIKDLVLDMRLGRVPVPLVIVSMMAAAEIVWLMLLRRTRDRDGEPHRALIALGAAVEANFPIVGVLLVTSDPVVGPFRALVSPIVMLCFLFIILSALRMRPRICILAGLSACAGYAATVAYTFARHSSEVSQYPITVSFVLSIAALLALAGVAAALVSWQILRAVSQAVEAVVGKRKLEEDMAVARKIQLSLLPEDSPTLQGFDLAGSSNPADQTGGDHFDWLPLNDGRIAITLADVTGHGIGSALLAANLHAYVHAVIGRGGGLCEWVNQLNRYMTDDLRDGHFVTFVVVAVRPSDGTMELLSAGHGPILLYRAERKDVVELGAQGVPLGVLDDTDYTQPHEIAMRAGDVLVLITDGFFEWIDAAGEQYGTGRLKDCWHAAAIATPRGSSTLCIATCWPSRATRRRPTTSPRSCSSGPPMPRNWSRRWNDGAGREDWGTKTALARHATGDIIVTMPASPEP